MATLEERYAKKQDELKQLRAQLDARKARERAQSEKWRTRALIQMGGDILRVSGLSWTQIDPDAFAAFLDAHRAEIAACKLAEPQDAKAAHEMWKGYKAAHRADVKKSAKEAAEAEDRAEPEKEEGATKVKVMPDPNDPDSERWRCPECNSGWTSPKTKRPTTCRACGCEVELVD